MSRDIYHIMSDYFCGKISDNDRKTLDTWITQPENKQIFDEYERVWKITGKISFDVKPDINAEWYRFKLLRRSVKSEKVIKLNPIFLRIAAVLIPAIVLFSVIYFRTSEKNELWVTFASKEKQERKILPDGTEVFLNRNSILAYPEKFGKKKRSVIFSGEAYFDVAKSKTPFFVDAGETSIKVLGTKFSIRNYKNERTTEVVVEEGKVLFSDQNVKNKSILVAGEKAVHSENKIVKNKIKNYNSFAWAKEKLVFDETPLKQIVADISNYFNKEIVIRKPIENCLFTGTFSNPELEEIIEIICTSVDCRYEIKNDTIFMNGASCKENN